MFRALWLYFGFVLVIGAGAAFVLHRGAEKPAPTASAPTVPQALDAEDLPLIEQAMIEVTVGPAASGVGTAFAIDEQGWMLTARHVVDSCDKVGVVVAPGRAVQVAEVFAAPYSDAALIRDPNHAGPPLPLDLAAPTFTPGEAAFHVGFPGGQPGHFETALVGRSYLVARGRYESSEPVLAWDRAPGMMAIGEGSQGISGGPAFGGDGQVIGITVAETTRADRAFTIAPATIARLLQEAGVAPAGGAASAITADTLWREADRLISARSVVQVACLVRP